MNTMWRTLTNVALILFLAAGAVGVLSGCEKNKNVGERVEEATEEAGEAVEEAGERAEKAL